MDGNVRPENMERITNKALADAFIEEQVKAIKEQVGDGKYFWHFQAVWIHQYALRLS